MRALILLFCASILSGCVHWQTVSFSSDVLPPETVMAVGKTLGRVQAAAFDRNVRLIGKTGTASVEFDGLISSRGSYVRTTRVFESRESY